MKTSMMLVAAACLAGVAGAAVPRVSNVRMTQDGKHRAKITYEISEAPGIATLDILTNGVPIGASVLTNATGDVNKLLGVGPHQIVWKPWETWPGHTFETASVTAKVTVWPTNAPPDWLAVELTKADYPVTYYATEDALPWGKIWQNKTYKGDVFLMRRIPASHAQSFMGSPESEANRIAGRETRRMCTLTNDYYMAIFPTTFRHYYLLNDHTATEARLTPVVTLSYNMLRYNTGNADNKALPVNFPTTSRTFVGGTSYLKAWRDKTGLTFDLPTSAQWEYACRAGMDTPINWPGGTGSMDDLGVVCQLGKNCYEVGGKGANSWYLFDTIGNCYEWVLDYFEGDSDPIPPDPVTDPFGPMSEPKVQRKIRGFHAQDIHKRAAFFTASEHLRKSQEIGFRLCVMLP